MKNTYIVVFDDAVEAYCRTLKSAKEVVDEMVEDYSCSLLSEKEIRKDAKIYKTKEVS